jgi:NAD(P)-dependent dehydrogenase (short-subunit alcohol dehydrogenase family)
MQLAHPLLKACGAGAIVFNSSVAGGPMAIKTGAVYAMTKGAALSLRVEVFAVSLTVSTTQPMQDANASLAHWISSAQCISRGTTQTGSVSSLTTSLVLVQRQ